MRVCCAMTLGQFYSYMLQSFRSSSLSLLRSSQIFFPPPHSIYFALIPGHPHLFLNILDNHPNSNLWFSEFHSIDKLEYHWCYHLNDHESHKKQTQRESHILILGHHLSFYGYYTNT